MSDTAAQQAEQELSERYGPQWRSAAPYADIEDAYYYAALDAGRETHQAEAFGERLAAVSAR